MAEAVLPSETVGRAALEARYRRALGLYLERGFEEAALVEAMTLGRTALAEGLGLLDLLEIHQSAMTPHIVDAANRAPAEIGGRLARAEEFLSQVMAPYEMTHRGWQHVIARLRRLNENLEQQVAERTAALSASLSERRATEAQLVQAQKMEAIGNLTGGLAHDFNNLLGVIIGNLDLMQDLLKDNAEAEELGREALDAALHGADLTRRLLAFARRQPLRPERIDLNDLVGSHAKLLMRTLGEDIVVKLELAAEVWPVVVDPAQLVAAITNLATNARDAMPGGGELVIATAQGQLDAVYAAQLAEVAPGDYVSIEVRDTGVGIAPEVKARIFEPFFTTKDVGKGSGLGLSMVFGFMKQSGGHINVYSELGQGTAIRLYLPRSPVETADTATPAPIVALPMGAGERVLVVEDNERLRRILLRQLADLGYRAAGVENAAEALAALEREAVELLFTDVVMPGRMSGLELAREATLRLPGLKVLFTSGFPEVRSEGNERLAEGVPLLRKPYRKDELARTLRKALEQ